MSTIRKKEESFEVNRAKKKEIFQSQEDRI